MPSGTIILDTNVGAGIETSAVRAHLEEIVSSREFANAPRLSRFLTFVVETALAGEGNQIKESLIAMEVYGRRPDYNPQVDSTVRVEAGRLRARLRQYYESRAGSTIEIELPKGTYAPVFHPRRDTEVKAVPVLEAVDVAPAVKRRARSLTYTAMLLGAVSVTALLVLPRIQDDADPKTLELYHRAQELLRIPVLKNGVPDTLPASVVEAVRLFGEVTARSPRFAKGWVGLAEAAEWEYELRGNQPAERLAMAKVAVRRAIELQPDLTEAWTLLTSILLYREWNFVEAERACRRALELDPRNTLVRQRYIDALRVMGRADEARAEVNSSIQLQPAAAAFRVRKAVLLYEAGRCDEAIPVASTAADLTNQMPVYPMTLWVQGLCLEQRGQVADAERIFRKALAYQPHDPWNEPALGHLLASAGRQPEAEEILNELRRQRARGRMTHFAMALVYTGLGKKEDALGALERAWSERDDAMLFVATDPRLRPLHAEARFQALVKRIQS